MLTAVTKHHHFVGNDLDARVFDTFLVIPAPCLQPSFYIDLLPLIEILLTNLRKVAPGYNVDLFCFVVTLTIHRIPRAADCHCKGCDRSAGWGIANLRVSYQVSDNLNFI